MREWMMRERENLLKLEWMEVFSFEKGNDFLI